MKTALGKRKYSIQEEGRGGEREEEIRVLQRKGPFSKTIALM